MLPVILLGSLVIGAAVAATRTTVLSDGQSDSSLPIRCDVCGVAALAFARRYSDVPSTGTAVWLRLPANWTVLLPVIDVAGTHCRCPLHAFPSVDGGPIRRTLDGTAWILPPGWYWAWLYPSEWPRSGVNKNRPDRSPYDDFQRRNRNVFCVRKSRGNPSKGTIIWFEVRKADLLWTLPGMPQPAPNGKATGFPEMTGGLAETGVPSEFVRFVEWAANEPWEVLRNEWQRLQHPTPREPFEWPWKR